MSLRLKFAADTCQLAAMRQAVRDYLVEGGVPEMEAELMVLALDEACTNVIRHAYGGCSQRKRSRPRRSAVHCASTIHSAG